MKIHASTQKNNLILNTDKTACTLFTPDPAEYNTQLELQIDNITLPMSINPKMPRLTLAPNSQKHTSQYRYLKHSHQQHGGTKGSYPRNIQGHNRTHTRVHFQHKVTTRIRQKHQQTTGNTKHRTQNSN